MGTENDKKVKDLLAQIEKKRQELGTKPKAAWKTNGVLRGKNINTINEIGACISETSQLLLEREGIKKACDFLGVQEQKSAEASWLDDALDDLKLRAQIVVWEGEKKKLQAMEAKLKDLRSNDAKTEDALGDIAEALK
jgi:hypothetical protein